MGVKIIKGVVGQQNQATNIQREALKVGSSAGNSQLQFASRAAAASDAVVTSLRSTRSEAAGEKLNLEKADKLAKKLGDDIRQDKELAMGAINDFSISAVRDAFGV
jgi:hypothetical protein